MLARSPFDPALPTLVGWLGVTYYLAFEVMVATFRELAALCAPSSELVFDHLDIAAFGTARSARMAKLFAIVEHVGEPFRTGLDPDELGELLASTGFELLEQLAPADLQARYLGDDHRAYEHFHVARARVAG